MLALFDPLEQCQNYIVLQEVLADLRLRERAELGRGFDALCERMARQGRGLSFCAAHFDGRDWVFVFISSRGREKADILNAATELTGAALAHYQKRDCIAIVDREGEHYDVLRSNPDYHPTPTDEENGRKRFAQLRMSDVDISRL
jgi:hypothetical protein